MPIVLTVGSLHYDIMVHADHLPRRDETAIGSRWFPKFGGKGGNQAVAAAKAGVGSRMVGAIGDDGFGVYLRQNLREGGVEDQFVATLPGVGSGMSVAIQDINGDYAATIVSGANLMISGGIIADNAVWQDVSMLVLQNEVPDAVNIAAATAANARGIRTVLNAAPYRPLSATLRGLVDVLVVNAVEAEMMGAGRVHSLDSAFDAAQQLAAQFRTVIVTAGSKGLAAWGVQEVAFKLPAETVKVASSHGAGDSFIGTLAARLAEASHLETACRAGSMAAARHVAGI